MANTNIPSPMKIAQMGECTNLWSELGKNPRYVIGGFTLNLADLRRLTGDTAAMSVSMYRFLDNCLYVNDSKLNTDELSVSELYLKGTSIEVVFDPLRAVELNWNGLEGLLNRTNDSDNFLSISYEEMMDQMETRILLFANRSLQRRLVKRLKEKQKEYQDDGKWYHLHERFRDFWDIAYEVCLDKTSGSSIAQRGAAAEILDWIFLANSENRAAYQQYLYTHYESERRMSGALNDILGLVEKVDQIIGKNSNGKTRPSSYKSIIFTVIQEVTMRWNSIWDIEHRPIFDAPLAGSFRENMASIDHLILNELIPLSLGSRKLSTRAHAETFGNLTDLLLTAKAGWRNLAPTPPNAKETVMGSQPDPVIKYLKEALDKIISQMTPDIPESDAEETAE